jgi:flagellar hook protein FlgE
MLESIYVGMSGLTAYAKGLQTISNNVANMNSPGFKATVPNFSDLYYSPQFAPGLHGHANGSHVGTGVEFGYASLNFQQGELRASNGQLDLGIQGDGFLALVNDAGVHYARTGQFTTGDDGFLTDKITGLHLAKLGQDGRPEAITTKGKMTSAPVATTHVTFADNLSSSATTFSIPNVIVYDAAGGKHTLKVDFTPDGATFPGRWKVTVSDEDSATVAEGPLQFLGGSPEPGMDSLDVHLTVQGTAALDFKLDFSSEVTSFSSGSTSTLHVSDSDGYAAGELATLKVDDDGVLVAGYSNGQSDKLGTIALARFTDEQSLVQAGHGTFDAAHTAAPAFVGSKMGGVGQLLSGQVEASNVDLSTEFGRMILIQRGFQASSQVVSTANEMLMQLFQMRGAQG